MEIGIERAPVMLQGLLGQMGEAENTKRHETLRARMAACFGKQKDYEL